MNAVGLAGHLKLGRLIVLWKSSNHTTAADLSRNGMSRPPRRGRLDTWDRRATAARSPAIEKAVDDERPSLIG